MRRIISVYRGVVGVYRLREIVSVYRLRRMVYILRRIISNVLRLIAAVLDWVVVVAGGVGRRGAVDRGEESRIDQSDKDDIS